MHSQRLRQTVAIVAAGMAGTFANAAAAALLIDGALIRFALAPGRYAIAVLVAAVLPFVFALCGHRLAMAVGVALLTVVPSLLAKLAFGAGAPWHLVLGLNAVYAVVAVGVFLASERLLPTIYPADSR